MKLKQKINLKILWIIITLCLIHLLSFTQSSANDMPLEGFPANGIVVRDEKNIQIEKETLYISLKRIEVSYIFRNNSDKVIFSEVAFPIPPYSYEPSGIIKYPVHGDFKVYIDGKEKKYQEITRALIGKKDYTSTLINLNISYKTFELNPKSSGVFNHQFYKLSKSEQKKLLDLGVVKVDEEELSTPPYIIPAWTVETTYFWSQLFPANSITKIKHTYTPNASHTVNAQADMSFINKNKYIDPKKVKLSELLCLNEEIKKWEGKGHNSMIDAHIVDYILTTANHWKKPIKEFHLIIEADQNRDANERVSTCFEKKKLKKINDKRYELIIKNYVPNEEIRVFFLSYPD